MNVESNDIIAIAIMRVSRQFFNLRNAKPKPMSLYVRDFSRALHVACDCREFLFVYPHCLLLIGRSNNFDIGFTIVIRKPPYTPFGCILLFARFDWQFYPSQNGLLAVRVVLVKAMDIFPRFECTYIKNCSSLD